MNNKEKIQWMNKNKRLNESINLFIGMEVKDVNGHKGIIVKIEKFEGDLNEENHGTIYVWQSDRTNYGSDNCEHYCLNNWKNLLRVLN